MVRSETYGHIVFMVISGQFTLEETEVMIRTLAAEAEAQGEVYLIGIPIKMTSFPAKVSDIFKVGNNIRTARNQVKRVYGIKYNPIFSFITTSA